MKKIICIISLLLTNLTFAQLNVVAVGEAELEQSRVVVATPAAVGDVPERRARRSGNTDQSDRLHHRADVANRSPVRR